MQYFVNSLTPTNKAFGIGVDVFLRIVRNSLHCTNYSNIISPGLLPNFYSILF